MSALLTIVLIAVDLRGSVTAAVSLTDTTHWNTVSYMQGVTFFPLVNFAAISPFTSKSGNRHVLFAVRNHPVIIKKERRLVDGTNFLSANACPR